MARLEVNEKDLLAYKPPAQHAPGRSDDTSAMHAMPSANEASRAAVSPNPPKKTTKPRANTKPAISPGADPLRPRSPHILDKLPPRPASSLGAISCSPDSSIIHTPQLQINPRRPLPPIARKSSTSLLADGVSSSPSHATLHHDGSIDERPVIGEEDAYTTDSKDTIVASSSSDASQSKSPEELPVLTSDVTNAGSGPQSQSASPLSHGTYSVTKQGVTSKENSPKPTPPEASSPQVTDPSCSSPSGVM